MLYLNIIYKHEAVLIYVLKIYPYKSKKYHQLTL
jgi:hypothetical protein